MTAETEKTLPVETGGGLKGNTLSLALHPLFRTLKTGWTLAFTRTLTGDLFRTDVAPRLETGHSDALRPNKLGDLFQRLGFAFRAFTAESVSGDIEVTQEAAWEAVCASIEQGIPAIGWRMMSSRQAMRGLSAYGYSLIRGYDRPKREYALFHAAAGEFRTRCDAPGQSNGDFWVGLFSPFRLEEDASLWRLALQSAVRHARQSEDPRMGLRALGYWIKSLESGDIAQYAGADTAALLMEKRETAAALLAEKAAGPNNSLLQAAALAYREEAAAYRDFLAVFPRYTEGGPGNHSNPETCQIGMEAIKRAKRMQEEAIEALEKKR